MKCGATTSLACGHRYAFTFASVTTQYILVWVSMPICVELLRKNASKVNNALAKVLDIYNRGEFEEVAWKDVKVGM